VAFDSPISQIYHPRGMGQPRRLTVSPIFFAMAMAAAIAVGGCNRSSANGAAPTTAPTTSPSKITVASLSPAATDLIVGMNAAADHLVAVTNYDPVDNESRKLPRVGDYQFTDWETLATVRPSILIVQMDPGRLPEGFRQKAERLGAKLKIVKIDELRDIFRAARQIGAAIGEPTKGEKLAADLSARIEAVRQRTANHPRLKTLLTLNEDAHTLIGSKTFLDDMLAAAGGDNAAASIGAPYPNADTETLLTLKPEAVIILIPGAKPDVFDRAKQFWSRLPNIPAARDGRIYLIADTYVLIPGSHVADITESMERCLAGGGTP
jgi:iron complex transport system substrate-binding protein